MDNEVIVDVYCGKRDGTFAITASGFVCPLICNRTPFDDMRLQRIHCYIPLNIPMIGKNVISLSMTSADSEYFIAGYVTQLGLYMGIWLERKSWSWRLVGSIYAKACGSFF